MWLVPSTHGTDPPPPRDPSTSSKTETSALSTWCARSASVCTLQYRVLFVSHSLGNRLGMWFTKGFIQNLQWRGFRCSREGSKLLRNDSLRGSLCELRPTSGKLWDACPGLPVVFCTAFEEKAVFPPFLWIRSNPSANSDRTPASSLSNRHSHGILTDPFRTRKDGQIHHPVRGSSAPSALRLPFPGDTARPSWVPSTWPEEQNPWDWKIGREGRVRFQARAAVDEADCAAEKHCIRDTVPPGRLRGKLRGPVSKTRHERKRKRTG